MCPLSDPPPPPPHLSLSPSLSLSLSVAGYDKQLGSRISPDVFFEKKCFGRQLKSTEDRQTGLPRVNIAVSVCPTFSCKLSFANGRCVWHNKQTHARHTQLSHTEQYAHHKCYLNFSFHIQRRAFGIDKKKKKKKTTTTSDTRLPI